MKYIYLADEMNKMKLPLIYKYCINIYIIVSPLCLLIHLQIHLEIRDDRLNCFFHLKYHIQILWFVS